MFTGIIQHLGKVATVQRITFGAVLEVDARGWDHRPTLGDSIAVNGCCLTVAAASSAASASNGAGDGPARGGLLRFDVIQQTLAATNLGDLRSGDPVNLEHAVTPQTMLGGHVVQGHIDGVGLISKVVRNESEFRLRIQPPHPDLMECIVEKGSIAVNGVSLTIASAGEDWFEVALIPTTLRLTNLGTLSQDSRVNLETDYIAKLVVNWMRLQRKA